MVTNKKSTFSKIKKAVDICVLMSVLASRCGRERRRRRSMIK